VVVVVVVVVDLRDGNCFLPGDVALGNVSLPHGRRVVEG
jgi:hypothetical protein